jgi:CIC family chloride channel protein
VAVGGLGVGVLAMAYPEVWGNGYGATNRILHEHLAISLLLGIFLAKFLATVITVGSGAVGGLFTPTLFLGAGMGGMLGESLHILGWASIPTSTFALVGMGSVLAASVHAPLLAMIMLFEISLNYSLMPPLMMSCAIASMVARSLHPNSVYTEPLRRKGVELDRESRQLGAATLRTVAEIMREPVPPLRETATFQQVTDRFITGSYNFLPVVDADQRLLGVVALHDLKEYLNAGQELNILIAYDVMRPPPPCLTPNQNLLEVLPVLLRSEIAHVPVVNSLREFRLVGTVLRSEGLGFLSEAIAARSS